MNAALSIDWLSFYGVLHFDAPEQEIAPDPRLQQPYDPDYRLPEIEGYRYERQPHSTRNFRYLIFVYYFQEKVCEVQMCPTSEVLKPHSCIVKFDNRLLYSVTMWYRIGHFITYHRIEPLRVSRVDICADFTTFHNYPCHDFICDFLSLKLRHIGRGDGQAYFHHKAKPVPDTKYKMATITYSGLSFGSHSSDVRVYLYDKTKELSEVHDKPHIRDKWVAAGLVNADDYQVDRVVETKQGVHTFFHNQDAPHVWRLEVSIKGDGIRFKNKETGLMEEITMSALEKESMVQLYYFTMVHYYFQFVKNRPNITNITREPRIDLWGKDVQYLQRIVPRSVSGGNRMERIVIRKLWHLHEEYRGLDNPADKTKYRQMAIDLASATDLSRWLTAKSPEWGHKERKV